MQSPPIGLDVDRIRGHFDLARSGRIVTNNAASTQPPRQLLDLYRSLTPQYENVHRGQSAASQHHHRALRGVLRHDRDWVNAPSRRSIATYRNTTEAHNAVMYSLLTEFRDGDNVVTTMLEHNSNFVPWHALCREILPQFGRRVDCRVARFDHDAPESSISTTWHPWWIPEPNCLLHRCLEFPRHQAAHPDQSGRSPTAVVICSRTASVKTRLLVDGAQLVPSSRVDVLELDVDYLSFSFHKFMAPFGVGVLYAKEHLLQQSRPFLYGGDMIADGGVWVDHVDYNELPWKYSAGTPNILGVIASAQALRLMRRSGSARPAPPAISAAASRFRRLRWRRPCRQSARIPPQLTRRAMDLLRAIPGLTIHGAADAGHRSPLVAFSIDGWDPVALAHGLNRVGVESRAGCHCATLAHRELGLLASCRLSFYLYNTMEDVERAVGAVRDLVRRNIG